MNTKIALVFAVAASLSALTAQAADKALPTHGSFSGISAATVAVSNDATQMASDMVIRDEARRHGMAKALAPIHSRADLQSYVVANKGDANPLTALSPDARQVFLSSLTFNEKGLTGFRYDVLESLTPTQIYKILSLFGVQDFTPQMTGARIVTPTDSLIMSPTVTPMLAPLKGYRCESRATCFMDSLRACTDNC